MDNCIFCKIAAGEAAADVIYQDELVTAFRDIHPVAPTHILVIPNRHLHSLNEAGPDDERVLGRLLHVAGQLARQEKIEQDGYRLIVNTGRHAGQVVFHLHLHLIGGRPVRHPMG